LDNLCWDSERSELLDKYTLYNATALVFLLPRLYLMILTTRNENLCLWKRLS